MIINCPNCNTKYSINKRVLGRSGKRVKCFSCNKEWFQKLEITDKKITQIIIETNSSSILIFS